MFNTEDSNQSENYSMCKTRMTTDTYLLYSCQLVLKDNNNNNIIE